MKKINWKMLAGCALLTLVSLTTYSQEYSKSDSANGKMHPTLDKSKIPKQVTDNFYMEYPKPDEAYWYDYPKFDSRDDWYDYDPYWYSAMPGNYAVEFKTNNIPYKAIYTKEGKKIAIHKISSDVPEAISASIKEGKYKSWEIGKDKEEIFKDKDTDQLRVYKITVKSGMNKHVLYYQKDGKLLKDVITS